MNYENSNYRFTQTYTISMAFHSLFKEEITRIKFCDKNELSNT